VVLYMRVVNDAVGPESSTFLLLPTPHVPLLFICVCIYLYIYIYICISSYLSISHMHKYIYSHSLIYSRIHPSQVEYMAALLAVVARPGAVILDVGSATGNFSLPYAHVFPQCQFILMDRCVCVCPFFF
jgi:hypothetical protein